jgi:hypothetical protein
MFCRTSVTTTAVRYLEPTTTTSATLPRGAGTTALGIVTAKLSAAIPNTTPTRQVRASPCLLRRCNHVVASHLVHRLLMPCPLVNCPFQVYPRCIERHACLLVSGDREGCPKIQTTRHPSRSLSIPGYDLEGTFHKEASTGMPRNANHKDDTLCASAYLRAHFFVCRTDCLMHSMFETCTCASDATTLHPLQEL